MNGTPKGELVCSASDIQVKQALRILVDGYPVAVVRDSMGDIHAIGDTCSHADISLSEGDVDTLPVVRPAEARDGVWEEDEGAAHRGADRLA